MEKDFGPVPPEFQILAVDVNGWNQYALNRDRVYKRSPYGTFRWECSLDHWKIFKGVILDCFGDR